jgi:SAM-dependent methyltransferase
MNLMSRLRQFVPALVIHKTGNFLRHTPRDLLDLVRGDVHPLVPPRRKIFIGAGEYRALGDEFFRYFLRWGEIKPHHRILDIGCGIGRMSRPFVAFLDPARGRFEGFDIDGGGIRWCQEHYAAYPHFQFQRADIFNKYYNPSGMVRAEDFTFPYADQSFDFAFATSVFTHMPLPSIARYLRETARVLVPGGRALFTVFFWNAEAQALVAQGKSKLPFREHGDLVVVDPEIPEDAIAIRPPDWQAALRDAGLEAEGEVRWGYWCGRAPTASFQDIVLARKAG